ncbi:MAG: universal stress protein [Pseudomonas sp.]|nr:universal stress protein [Pseudomonas sp.]
MDKEKNVTTNTVMACVDGSQSSPAVCDYAAWASLRLNASLTFLHVLDHSRYPVESNLSGNIGLGSREHLLAELAELDEKRGKLMREQGRHMLEAAVERARTAGVAAATGRQRHGDLVETLAELQGEIRLLVIGRAGEEGDSVGGHVGSHLESVVRTLHKPTLVTAGVFRQPRSVMLAFDNGPSTRKGIDMMAASPLFQGLPIHLLMVGADTQEASESVNAAKQMLENSGHQVQACILAGNVEEVLLGYQEEHDIDMIVMGAYGHSRVRQFFVGSTTTKILTQTRRPLLLLR